MYGASDAKFWLRFFMEAGIPHHTAMQYAITFSDNRIDSHMLSDLTREYLREMKITLIGDVIAILKHADQVAKANYFNRKTSNNLNASGGESSKRPSNSVLSGASAAVSSAGPRVTPYAGVYTVHVPPSERGKAAEAERRRRLLEASSAAHTAPKLANGLQNLRVVRTANGQRVVSSRATQEPAGRLGKRTLATSPLAHSVSFNVLVGADGKRRKLSNGDLPVAYTRQPWDRDRQVLVSGSGSRTVIALAAQPSINANGVNTASNGRRRARRRGGPSVPAYAYVDNVDADSNGRVQRRTVSSVPVTRVVRNSQARAKFNSAGNDRSRMHRRRL